MAGTGKLTDVELLNLIQHISERSLKQSADPDEQEKNKSVENVTVDQTVVEDTRLATVEKLEAEDKLKLLTYSEREHDAEQLPQSVQTAELVPESPSNVIKVADQQVDFDIHCISLGTQSGCQKLTSTVEQSFKSAKGDLQSNVYFPVKNMSGLGVKSPQTRSQYSETSQMKEVSQLDVISSHKTESQTNLSSLVEVESNTSVTYTDKQITDSETLPPDTSVSLVDVKSPSYKIDAELVALLSTEEITNLVHEYRTELESTKKKLDRSERQLAKANDYNNVLRNMVEQLSSDIHRMKHMKTCSVHVQVDKEDFLEYTTGRSSMPNWQAEDDHSTVPMDISHAEDTAGLPDSNAQQQPVETDTGTLSIADSIKQAAEAVVQRQQADMLHDSGYVYDEHSGLYYHPASGYYYDQQKSLFYDPKTGTYYYYDYDRGEYMFHSQVELPSQAQEADQSSVKVDLSFKKKYSDAKKSLRTPKTNRSRERHSCDERVFKNRKERRRAEQEKRRQQREEMYKMRQYKDRGRKRRHESLSYSSGSSRSRSRTCSRDRDQRNSKSQGRDKRSHKRSGRLSKDSSRNDRSEKIDQNRRESVSLESVSGESDMQTEKSNREVKVETANFDTASNSKRLGNISNRSKSENLDKSSRNHHADFDSVREDSGDNVEIQTKDTDAESYEVDSENELMIIEDDTNDHGKEDKGVETVINTKYAQKVCSTTSEEETVEESHERSDRIDKHSKTGNRNSVRSHTHKSKKSKNRKYSTDEGSCSEIESGELSDTDSESSSYSKSFSSFSSEASGEGWFVGSVESDEQEVTEVAVSYPPCIRVMVMESECLAVGSLFIVTCTGAKIGRENCDICIPDINVSKLHAEICYNKTSQQYEIYDHASQNGTFLNNRRLSAAKKASDPAFISHNDCVYISSTKLLCHIHPGSDTCDHCEPGVVMATHKAQQSQTELKVLSKEERLRQKKQELNQIKKKYGLKNSAYENNPEVFNNPNYTDKAEERRKHVGSDIPGQKSEAPASVHRPISTGNVGHKLLQKMGWKEGDSLGKNNTGIQEPVTVTLRASQKAGLGSAGAAGFSADIANNADMKKATRRIQAQQRYKQIETGNQKSSASVAGKVWTKGATEFT